MLKLASELKAKHDLDVNLEEELSDDEEPAGGEEEEGDGAGGDEPLDVDHADRDDSDPRMEVRLFCMCRYME